MLSLPLCFLHLHLSVSISLFLLTYPLGLQSVIPLFVTTKLSKFRRPTRFIPTPETFVKSAIRTIGLDTQTCGYFFHDVQLLAAKVLPESMTNAHLSKLHLGFRKRALAKLESEKQK